MATLPFIMLLLSIKITQPLPIKVQHDDSMLEGLRAAVDVMNCGLDNAYSTIPIILDGFIHSSTVFEFIGKTGFQLGVSVYDVANDKSNRTVSAIVSSMQQLSTTSRALTLIIASDDTTFLLNIIKQFLSVGILDWTRKLLVITQSQITELQKLAKYLSVTNSLVISTKAAYLKKRCEIYFYQPYSHRLVNIATWSANKGLQQKSSMNMFPEKFTTLTDLSHLTVTGEEYPPHLKLQEYEDIDGKQRVAFSGPARTLLDIFAENINFTYTLVRPPDRSWGYLLPDRSWTGMVGQVAREEVDLALGPFGISMTRAQAVDYTSPLVVDYARITARRGVTEVDPWSFALPLTAPVWIACFSCFALALFTVWSIVATVMGPLDKPLQRPLLNYVRVLLQQNLEIQNTMGWSERFILGAWIITVMVLMESYSSNLMSLLAVRYVAQPFQTVQDVVNDTAAIMLWEANTAYVQHLMNAESGVFHSVAEARHTDRLSYLRSTEYSSAMETRIMDGSHVLMIENLALKMLLAEHFTKTGSCKFYLSKEMFLPFTFAMIVQKYNPLGPSLSKRIESITESGLYDQWLENAVPNSTSCSQAPSKVVVKDSLSFKNVWGIFVVLLGGFLTSINVLWMEIALKFLKHNPESN